MDDNPLRIADYEDVVNYKLAHLKDPDDSVNDYQIEEEDRLEAAGNDYNDNYTPSCYGEV